MSKKISNACLVLVATLAVAGFLAPQTACATATAESEFTVYWETLQITQNGVPVTPSINWEYRGISSEGTVNGPETSNPGYATGMKDAGETRFPGSSWTKNPLSVNNTIGANSGVITGNSTATQELLTSRTYSQSSGAGDKTGWVNGNIHRGVMYTLDPGTYHFSVDYRHAVSLTRQNASLEGASNYAQLTLYLEDNVNQGFRIGVFDPPLAFASSLGSNDLTYEKVWTGTIGFDVTLPQENQQPGGWEWLEAHIHTSTSTYSNYSGEPPPTGVPEPATMLLLGLGLAGLAGAARFGRR